jgi:hypothetical protein
MENFDEFNTDKTDANKEFLREITKIKSHTLQALNGSILGSFDKKQVENYLNTIYNQLDKLKDEFKKLNLK